MNRSSIVFRSKKTIIYRGAMPRPKIKRFRVYEVAEGETHLKPTHAIINALLKHGSLSSEQLWQKVQSDPLSPIKNKTRMKAALRQLALRGSVNARADGRLIKEILADRKLGATLSNEATPPYLWKLSYQPLYSDIQSQGLTEGLNHNQEQTESKQ